MAGNFVPFNPQAEFTATQRNLPHWQQPKATYFVTFRLIDSLPMAVREKYEELQRLNSAGVFDWVEHYLDAGNGDCVLSDPGCSGLMVEALTYFDGTRYMLGDFVVMPNHVHVLVQPMGYADLSSVMHTWKSYTSHEINRRIGKNGARWQKESFDRIVRDEVELRKFSEYIIANPTTAGLAATSYRVGRGLAKWFDAD